MTYSHRPASSIHSHPSEPTGHRAVLALADIINQFSTGWSDFGLCMPQYFHRLFQSCPYPQIHSISLFTPIRWGELDIQWDNLTHLHLHNMYFVDCFLPPYCTRPVQNLKVHYNFDAGGCHGNAHTGHRHYKLNLAL
jgi:hypothetical protein